MGLFQESKPQKEQNNEQKQIVSRTPCLTAGKKTGNCLTSTKINKSKTIQKKTKTSATSLLSDVGYAETKIILKPSTQTKLVLSKVLGFESNF